MQGEDSLLVLFVNVRSMHSLKQTHVVFLNSLSTACGMKLADITVSAEKERLLLLIAQFVYIVNNLFCFGDKRGEVDPGVTEFVSMDDPAVDRHDSLCLSEDQCLVRKQQLLSRGNLLVPEKENGLE